MWINGIKIDEVIWLDVPCQNDEYLMIAKHVAPVSTQEKYINGVYDDIRIYNRPLSESEIQGLYNEGGPIDTDGDGIANYEINFDDLSEGENVTTQYQLFGVIFSSDGLLSITTEDEHAQAISPPNVLRPSWNGENHSYIGISFNSPANNVSFWLLGIGDWSVNVRAYNAENDLLESINIDHPNDEWGLENQDFIALDSTSISHLTISHGEDRWNDDGFSFDQFKYSLPE